MSRLEDLPMWGVKEVADYFRISPKTVWEMARIPKSKGGPPICRMGRIIRFPTQEFIAWSKAAKPFKTIAEVVRPRRKKHVLNDNRVRRVTRAVDVAV